MKHRAKSKLVMVTPTDLRPPTPADVARLRRAAQRPADFSEVPELFDSGLRSRRDASGRLPKVFRSPVLRAVSRELRTRRMTGHQLWKQARRLCPTLTESAVYEFLRGERQIGLTYLDAILGVLDLEVRRARRSA
jgi:hypothetical protein